MNAPNDSVWRISFRHQYHIFLDLDTQCKALTEQVGVITAARDAALAENATLSANIAQLEVNLIFFYMFILSYLIGIPIIITRPKQ